MGSPPGSRKDIRATLEFSVRHDVSRHITKFALQDAGKVLKLMEEGKPRGRGVLVLQRKACGAAEEMIAIPVHCRLWRGDEITHYGSGVRLELMRGEFLRRVLIRVATSKRPLLRAHRATTQRDIIDDCCDD